MHIEISDYSAVKVLQVSEDLDINSDITELRFVVEQQLQLGNLHFAFSFTKNSYLYTRSIAILISCAEMIKEQHGTLAIVNANEDILDLINLIDFDKVINVCNSLEELKLPQIHTQ